MGTTDAAWAAVTQYAIAQRDAIVGLGPRAVADEPDAAHKMRVACRRLRSVLATFRPFVDEQLTDPVRGELRWVAHELGPTRDTEVLADKLERAVEDLPESLRVGPVDARLGAYLSRETTRAHEQAARALGGDRYAALVTDLDVVVEDMPDAAAGPSALLRRVDEAAARVDEWLDRSGELPPGPERTAALHEARKAGKRVRYAAEALRGVGADAAERLIDVTRALQDVLGTHRDAITAQAALSDLAHDAHCAGENAFTYGLLYAHETSAGDAELAKLPGVTKAFRRADARSWLVP